jgi:hypothetical protein
MDRCPKVTDIGQETCQQGQGQWQQPDWAREYSASFYAGGCHQVIIESNGQVLRPEQQVATNYDCWGGQGGYQNQQPYVEYYVRYYGQPGYSQGYDSRYAQQYQQYYAQQYQQYYAQQYQQYYAQQYQQYYAQQYQQYYAQQYQQYYAQQYQNYYAQRGGYDQGTYGYRGGCGCGCGGSRCGGRGGYSYRYEQYGGRYQERYQQRYSERYEDQRYYQDQRYNQRGRFDSRGGYQGYDSSMDANLKYTVDSMVGHSIREYDRRVPETLGCARFVSAALERAYGLPIRDSGCSSLEQSLKRHGFVAVPLDQAQPGDVIIGHRSAGDHGHAAIYYGNGMIANNSSNERRIAIQSVNKFYASDFRKVVAYRRA